MRRRFVEVAATQGTEKAQPPPKQKEVSGVGRSAFLTRRLHENNPTTYHH